MEEIDDDNILVDAEFMRSIRWMQLVDGLRADNNRMMINEICEEAITLYSIALNARERLTWNDWHHPVIRISHRSKWTNFKLNVLIAEGHMFIGDSAKAVERYHLATAEDTGNSWLLGRIDDALLKYDSLTKTERE